MTSKLTDAERTVIENARIVRNAALEEAASVVDQCNREGPYQAIGAAERIRSLKVHHDKR
jgi:CRISPR/Cas system-associated protein Csm6